MPPTSPAKPGRIRISLLAVLQLAVCLLALWWAWRAWQSAEGVPTDRFWGAVALALFAGGLAQINLVGPLRERFAQPSTSRLALPVRLSADGAPQGLEWPMFSLAVAFGAPFWPLLMLIFSAETKWMVELQLIWIGLAFLSLFVAGVGIYLGGRGLYRRLAGGQTIVEVETDQAQADQTMSGFVWYQPGRVPAENIEISLVGQKTFTKRVQSRSATSQSPLSSRTETTVLHQQVVCPATALDPAAGPWQKQFSFTIPADALSSAPHTANPMITWGLEVRVNLKGTPDMNLTFPFIVHGIEPDYNDEEADELPGEPNILNEED
jgi:hypothetical protein